MDSRVGRGLSCSRPRPAVPRPLHSLSVLELTARLSCPCCWVCSREHCGAVDSPPSEHGSLVGFGGIAGAAKMARAWILASLPACSCKVWLFGSGPAQLPVPGKLTWALHTRTVLVGELFISFVHLCALSAVGNSFRQFLLLLLMLTMVGTCLLLALFFSTASVVGQVLRPARKLDVKLRASSFSSMK